MKKNQRLRTKVMITFHKDIPFVIRLISYNDYNKDLDL